MAYNRFRGTESRGVAIAQHSVTGFAQSRVLVSAAFWFFGEQPDVISSMTKETERTCSPIDGR